MASVSWIHRPAHVQSQRLFPLRNWSSTLLCAFFDLCTWSGRVSLAYKAPFLIALLAVLVLLTSFMTVYSPCCGILRPSARFLVVVCLLGGFKSVILRASSIMVHGGTIVGIHTPCCTLGFERFVWHSIEQCARLVVCFGRSGNLVSRDSQNLSLDWQLPSSATLSVAKLIRVATNLIT